MNDLKALNTTPLLMMGVLLILLGVVAIATPAVAGTTVIIVVGVMLLLAGIGQVISGFRSEGMTHRLPPIILGLITAAAGIGVLAHPILGLKFLTILLMAFFIFEGVWKIFISFSYRPATGWLGMLFSGIFSLVFAWLIWVQWPVSGMWAVGVLVGVDLLMTGIALVAIAYTVRQVRRLITEREAAVAEEQATTH